MRSALDHNCSSYLQLASFVGAHIRSFGVRYQKEFLTTRVSMTMRWDATTRDEDSCMVRMTVKKDYDDETLTGKRRFMQHEEIENVKTRSKTRTTECVQDEDD